jgi:glycosyltransferase involved in cell wall biosynthesis
MGKIAISVVTTVFNEVESIEILLRSLVNQTVLPKEIVIVDAGSSDDTVLRINRFAKSSVVPIRVLVRPGMNRSKGRNEGISSATCGHIAVIDAGCEADSLWLEELLSGFEVGEAVAGYYLPVIKHPLQRLFAAYVSISPASFDEATYLPSSRSLAFTKKIWEKVGRYPVHLSTCEDLVFAQALKKTGDMVVRKKAIVFWRQVDTFADFFYQLRGYAQGDIEASYRPHAWKVLSVWGRYALILLYPPLFFVYMLYPVIKHRKEILTVSDGFLLPAVQITADAAVMVGSLMGLLSLVGLLKR